MIRTQAPELSGLQPIVSAPPGREQAAPPMAAGRGATRASATALMAAMRFARTRNKSAALLPVRTHGSLYLAFACGVEDNSVM